MTRTFEFVRDFEGDIPGAAPRDCGNWRDENLDFAHWYARRYLDETLYGIDEPASDVPGVRALGAHLGAVPAQRCGRFVKSNV